MAQPTMEDAQKWIKDHEEERSPVRGVVYSDGTNSQIQYLWQDPTPVPEGFARAGTLYAVPCTDPTDDGWLAKAHTLDEKWCGVMEQALPLFEAEVKAVISLLNAKGLSLADLPAFLKIGNDPEKLKALEDAEKSY